MAACLIETSILDRLCAPLCQAVHSTSAACGIKGPDSDPQRFIQWLIETDLFLIPLDDQGYWFRFHHLFQDFLQTQLRQKANADTIAKLHLQNIYRKLDARGRMAALKAARVLGLIPRN